MVGLGVARPQDMVIVMITIILITVVIVILNILEKIFISEGDIIEVFILIRLS
jgi:hypothetical protein